MELISGLHEASARLPVLDLEVGLGRRASWVWNMVQRGHPQLESLGIFDSQIKCPIEYMKRQILGAVRLLCRETKPQSALLELALDRAQKWLLDASLLRGWSFDVPLFWFTPDDALGDLTAGALPQMLVDAQPVTTLVAVLLFSISQICNFLPCGIKALDLREILLPGKGGEQASTKSEQLTMIIETVMSHVAAVDDELRRTTWSLLRFYMRYAIEAGAMELECLQRILLVSADQLREVHVP